MASVRFSDVVRRVNQFVDRHNTDLLYYVGGEHMESQELMVRDKGLIKGSTIGYKFHFGFEPGHILFGSRNPHLKKCSMADFPGVCSDSTYVVETRDPDVLDQRYLLLEMQSDRFWDWAEENKSGSVNYLINYCTLEEYEFDLPPIEKQRELAELLWAANDLKEAYRKAIAATDEMLKAKFREMFGDVDDDGSHGGTKTRSDCAFRDAKMRSHHVCFSDCVTRTFGGKTPSMSRNDFYGGQIPFVKSGDIRSDYISCGSVWLTEAALSDGGAKYIPKGSVMVVVRSATLKNELRVAIASNDVVINQDIKAFLPSEHYLSEFLMRALRMNESTLLNGVKTMLTSHIETKDIYSISIPDAPLRLQREFVAIAEKADAAKAALKKSIADIDQVMKGLING